MQKYVYFEKLKLAVSEIRRTPATMAAAMVILALLCAGLSLLVLNGFSSPYLIGPAVDALFKGMAP